MKIKFCILFLFVTSKNLYAQFNLVPNPSFEIYDTCNTNTSTYIENAIGWYNANTASPDYYNECSDVLSVPICNPSLSCYQYAHSGVAYSGIYCYDSNYPNSREYI